VPIGLITIPEKDPDNLWLTMFRNVMVDEDTMLVLAPILNKRFKFKVEDNKTQNEFIVSINDYVDQKKGLFGKQFRAQVTCVILCNVFRDDDIFLEAENTGANLTALSPIMGGHDVMMNKIITAVREMYVPYRPYIHTPIQIQVDPLQPENNDENMEELTPEEKLQRLYLTEFDCDMDTLILSAKLQLKAPYHENNVVINYIIDAITDAFKPSSIQPLDMKTPLRNMPCANLVERIIDTYYHKAKNILTKHVKLRTAFVKAMKNGDSGHLLKTKAVKIFLADFANGMNQCVSTMIHATHNERISMRYCMLEYGKSVNTARITPVSEIENRQNILPNMNVAMESWMTTELKSNLPIPIMALFLPLNEKNNSVPITVHGFNNRSIDMHRISTPKQGWHSFDETIKGVKQGSFDAKLTVSFFKQMETVSSLWNMLPKLLKPRLTINFLQPYFFITEYN
jgi:hypothetical protein